jgi:hypothetical protein
MGNVNKREECIEMCVNANVDACSFHWNDDDKGCYGIYDRPAGAVGGGKYACMDMHWKKRDNYLLYNSSFAELYQHETKTRFECGDMGFWDWKDTCKIEYWNSPCMMEQNNCTLYYYDFDGNWHADNCTNNLSDVYEWNMEIKYSAAW